MVKLGFAVAHSFLLLMQVCVLISVSTRKHSSKYDALTSILTLSATITKCTKNSVRSDTANDNVYL